MSRTRYAIEHVTRYVHADRTSTSHHVACLRPRALARQCVVEHRLEVLPAPADRLRRVDYFGNEVEQFTVLTPYRELQVTGRSVVDVIARTAPVALTSSPAWEDVRDGAHAGRLPRNVQEFLFASPLVDIPGEIEHFARPSFPSGRPILEAAVDLMARIHRTCRFDPGTTSVATPVRQVLAERHGVCQDFAHLQIAAMRALGLPVRYVSGYLLTTPPPGQPRLQGADASHAWVSVYTDDQGWVDVDPTNNLLPDDRHITLAWGRDYGDVSPLRGVVLGGGPHVLHVGVNVTPVAAPDDSSSAA